VFLFGYQVVMKPDHLLISVLQQQAAQPFFALHQVSRAQIIVA